MAKKRPSRKKKPAELTDDQALRRLFPKEVREEIKREVKEADRKGQKGKKRGAGGHNDES